MRHSACSALAPDELCRLALERGLDGLVLTEHHYQWSREDLDVLEQAHPPLRLYAGIELTLAERHDVVLVAPPALLARCGIAQPFLPLAELARRLAPVRSQVFAFVAHPFRYTCELSAELHAILQWVDGVEENSVNLLRHEQLRQGDVYWPANRACYLSARAHVPRIALYNTDCHRPSGVGVLSNQLPGPPPADEAALVLALNTLPITQWQHPHALPALLAAEAPATGHMPRSAAEPRGLLRFIGMRHRPS